MPLLSIPPASAALFGIALLVLVGSNGSLMSSGWLDEFKKKPQVTGVFLLDLLIDFFPQVIKDPSGSAAWLLLANVSAIGSNLVIVEGSRRRGANGGFSQILLAAYWWIAQFVAIGVATPLFFGLYLMKPLKDQELVRVGTWRAGSALIAVLGTFAFGVAVEKGVYAGDGSTPRAVVGFLMYPILVFMAAILFDRPRTSPPSERPLLNLTFVLCGLIGLLLHLRLIKLVLSGEYSVSRYLANPPAVFLAFDLFGVASSTYIWLAAEGKVSVFEQWPMFFLFGPGFHATYLSFVREKRINHSVMDTGLEQAQ